MKRVWELETALRDLNTTFTKPNMHFEQYVTPPAIASQCLWSAMSDGNITGCVVADLGCGTGILGAGSALLGAEYVLCVDVDRACLDHTMNTFEELELSHRVGFIQFDLLQPQETLSEIKTSPASLRNVIRGTVDTVVMNPPFGTKTQSHADTLFVAQGLRIAQKAVYSMHLSCNRSFLQQWGVSKACMELVGHPVRCTPVAELKYNIDACYGKHKK
eukprot:PhF_6_TR9732/c0_g1_i2/m.14985